MHFPQELFRGKFVLHYRSSKKIRRGPAFTNELMFIPVCIDQHRFLVVFYLHQNALVVNETTVAFHAETTGRIISFISTTVNTDDKVRLRAIRPLTHESLRLDLAVEDIVHQKDLERWRKVIA